MIEEILINIRNGGIEAILFGIFLFLIDFATNKTNENNQEQNY